MEENKNLVNILLTRQRLVLDIHVTILFISQYRKKNSVIQNEINLGGTLDLTSKQVNSITTNRVILTVQSRESKSSVTMFYTKLNK